MGKTAAGNGILGRITGLWWVLVFAAIPGACADLPWVRVSATGQMNVPGESCKVYCWLLGDGGGFDFNPKTFTDEPWPRLVNETQERGRYLRKAWVSEGQVVKLDWDDVSKGMSSGVKDAIQAIGVVCAYEPDAELLKQPLEGRLVKAMFGRGNVEISLGRYGIDAKATRSIGEVHDRDPQNQKLSR